MRSMVEGGAHTQPIRMRRAPLSLFVIPAQAGIHCRQGFLLISDVGAYGLPPSRE